ncbi:multicopper oxidase family protein [Kiloniella laminariae]|uniref:Multicopper oxidase family protein n=1 Tax=Kiloniella laminariae TaxID=454162 RepID=A0ABT4LEP6_9PROT|nr:multicopper oxidase family protein [Kiloniella laminariae]MCZ4279576.1 multicopper oxidase family protein [Kiloniella laminariae]
MTKIKRRTFLKGAAALSASGALLHRFAGGTSAQAQEAATLTARSPLGISDDLFNPPEISSINGQLRTNIYMGFNKVILPSGPTILRNFNNSLPGPTLRINAGDTLELAFENRLPENRPDQPTEVNIPNHFNTTNLHYHGFHVSPKGNSDNVYLNIEPGEKFNYVVQVPRDHPAGSYWYHPHRHGSVSAQVAQGAAGMAIIAGALDDVPEIKEAVERVLVIQAPIPGVDGILDSEDPIWPLDAERDFLVNGEYKPRIYIREGEVQRWRILHAGDAQFFPFKIDGLEIYEIGRDGNPLPEARLVEEVHLSPGNRVDVLVKGATPGAYLLRRPFFDQGKQSLPPVHLANIFVIPANDSRVPPGTPFGREIPKGPLPDNPILVDITDAEITHRRKIVLGVEDVKGYFHDTLFTINDEPFDPKRDDVVSRLGAVEEWTLINKTPFPHPIHIHVNPFQVMSVNGVADPDKPWMDTIAVPAAGTVVFRTRFLDFDGRYVMHCHILPHEDTGMMINVNIEP